MAGATFVLVFCILLTSNLSKIFTEARAADWGKSLYDPSTDFVVVMDNSSLDKTVYDSPKAWFVEFYSSWCGHCVHFAPTYKSFAQDVKDWKDIVDVGAIDCAVTRNLDTCRNHQVQAFPSMRVYHPYTKFNTTGQVYKGGRGLSDLRHGMIDTVEAYEPDERWKHNWPHLKPVNASWIVEFFQISNTANVKYLAVVFEDSQSYHGRELILDMTPHRSDVIICRTLIKDNPLIDKWFIQDFPSLFVIETDLSPKALSLSGTRETFRQRLLQFLGKSSHPVKGSPAKTEAKVAKDNPKMSVQDTKQPLRGGVKTEGAQIPALEIADQEEKGGFIGKSQQQQNKGNGDKHNNKAWIGAQGDENNPEELHQSDVKKGQSHQHEGEDGDEDSQGAGDSLKDDFEAGEENALVAGLAVPDDFNAELGNKGGQSKMVGKKDLSQMTGAKAAPSQQELWDKVHQKGKEKAEAIASEEKMAKRPPIHMLDLESTLHYALRHEIPLHGIMKEGVLEALKVFVTALARYFPGRPQVMNYLENLRFWLEDSQKDEISSDDWLNFVNRQYDPEMPEDAFLPKQITWIGCAGSLPRYRGYPCGLWMLFHSLTVSHVSTNRMIDDPNVFEVLHAMRSFIKHFFSCRECSKNFSKESATLDFEVKTLDDSILWLWRVHNRVNQRLHGDETEDPKYPKVLFPPSSVCPSCRGGEDAMWQEKNVLVFLKDFYGLKNINFDNLKTELDESDHRVSEGQSAQEVKRKVRERFRQKEVELRLQRVEGKLGGGYFGLGVNSLDLSMCFVLYFMCAALVIFIYMLIWRRRRRRLPKYNV